MNPTRRRLLLTAASSLPAFALPGCAANPNPVPAPMPKPTPTPAPTPTPPPPPVKMIAIGQSDLAKAAKIIAAVDTVTADPGNAITLASVEQQVEGYLAAATSAIGGLISDINALVPVTDVSAVLSDLADALNAVAILLPNNAYISAAQLVLAALSDLWDLTSMVALQPIDTGTLAVAMQLLAPLPVRPALSAIAE